MDDLSEIKGALKLAIQIEIDGKQFYTRSGKESNNELGKELFAWLAVQEDKHRQRFQGIYDSLAEEKGWPVTKIKPDKGSKPATIFSRAARESGSRTSAKKAEFAAADEAMEMEIKSRDFYRQLSAKATSPDQKKFFDLIAAEEQGHYLYLVDYKEYMTDPVDWFTRTEHHLLDGA